MKNMGDATQKTVRCYTGTRVVPHFHTGALQNGAQ
jgi:hypothetical protein